MVDLFTQTRDTIELATMRMLNEQQDYSRHIYDCFDWGILDLQWIQKKWYARWIELEPMPDRVLRLIRSQGP
jgi:hypothetical protein